MQGRKILIIQTAFIGDAILATALVSKIHTHEPEARIDFLCRKGNEGLLQSHPYIQKVWIWDKKQNKIKNLLRLIASIRRTKYDEVINLQRFFATGLLTCLSGAGNKVGFTQNPLSMFFNKHLRHDMKAGLHEVHRNGLLYQPDDINSYRPALFPSSTDISYVQQWIQTPYITIAPASVWQTKKLPTNKWIELIQHIPPHVRIYLLGGMEDVALCDEILHTVAGDNCINLAGKLSLLQSAALMQKAAMNYVNDSAPLHLCSAMNAPTCAIFCSTVPSFGFGPLSDIQYIVEVAEQLTCRPCGKHGKKTCPLGHFNCGNKVTVEQLSKPILHL